MNNQTVWIVIILIIIVVFCLFSFFFKMNFNQQEGFCENHQEEQAQLYIVRNPQFFLKFMNAWVQHLFYTRLIYMAFFADAKSLPSIQQKLLQNQKDIGNLFAQMYGKKVGDDITKALTEHIQIAVEVLTAIREEEDAESTLDKFYQNAEDIGKYLDNLKGTNGLFTRHMKTHIDTLVKSVDAFIKNDFQNDIKFNDQYLNSGVKMAYDMLSK